MVQKAVYKPGKTPGQDFVQDGRMVGDEIEVCLPYRAGGWFHDGGWAWSWFPATITKVNPKSLYVTVHFTNGDREGVKIGADRARVRNWHLEIGRA